MPVLRTKTSRMWLPDALRGLALLNMLAYHAMYDWVYVFGHESNWYNIWAPGCHVWQQYICWSFILLSGFSFPLAKRPAKNGLIVAGCAAVLTFVTAVFMPSEAIWFGVLHLNAAAVLLTCLVYPLLQRLPAGAGLAASAALFALTNQLPEGYFGLRELAALCGPCGAVPGQPVLAGPARPDKVHVGGLFPRSAVGVFVLVRCVSGRALEAQKGRSARCFAPAVCRGAEHTARLYAPPAGDLRRALGGACGDGAVTSGSARPVEIPQSASAASPL